MTGPQAWLPFAAPGQTCPPPLFVLTHDGVPPAFLEDLLAQTDTLSPVQGLAGMLPDLARAWVGLRQQQPLRNLRKSNAGLPPWHPWFGAARTDPWALNQGLGRILIDHMQRGLAAQARPVVVISELLWDWDDCLGLADFLASAFPNAMLLLLTQDRPAAQARLAEVTGWPPEKAGRAAVTMNGHFQALTNHFPRRTLLWTLSAADDPAARAAQLADFLAGDAPAAETAPGPTTVTDPPAETDDAPTQDV